MMTRPRTLAVLVILGLIAVIGGWYFGVATKPTEQNTVDTGKLMFPGLAERLKDAAKIEVVHQGKPMVIEKKETSAGPQWGVDERDGYRVQESKLRGMLTALTELRLIEPRTSDPAQFSRLGVEDASAKDSNSNLLRVLDGGAKPIAELIVGHRRVRTQGNVPDQVYVRRPRDTQAWLAEGSLQVDSDPQLWLDRDITNIDHARMATVAVTRGDEKLTFGRDGDKLVLKTPAEHPKLDDYRLEDVSRALELLTFQDVRSDKDAPGDMVGESVFTTSDGLSIKATVFEATKDGSKDRDVWAHFAASGNDKTKAEADRIQSRVNRWIYQLGSWKEKALLPTLEDLKAPPERPPAPATTGSGSDAPSATQ